MIVYYTHNGTILSHEVAPSQVRYQRDTYCHVELYISHGEPHIVEAWTDYAACRDSLITDMRAKKLLLTESIELLKQADNFQKYTELCHKT